MRGTAAEFREFLLKQNALALAVGVIIGAAIGKVVSGVVDDLLMPVIGLILPAGDWRNAQIALGGNAIKYGDLLGRVVDFLVIAAVVCGTCSQITPVFTPAFATSACTFSVTSIICSRSAELTSMVRIKKT